MPAKSATGQPLDNSLLSDYLDEKQTAVGLNIATKTLRRWEEKGEGPPITRMGRRVLYSKKAIALWLASCEKNPVPRDRRSRLRKRGTGTG